jgi:hypothetical protein
MIELSPPVPPTKSCVVVGFCGFLLGIVIVIEKEVGSKSLTRRCRELEGWDRYPASSPNVAVYWVLAASMRVAASNPFY